MELDYNERVELIWNELEQVRASTSKLPYIKWVKLSERTGGAEHSFLCGAIFYRQRLVGKSEVIQLVLCHDPSLDAFYIISYAKWHAEAIVFPTRDEIMSARERTRERAHEELLNIMTNPENALEMGKIEISALHDLPSQKEVLRQFETMIGVAIEVSEQRGGVEQFPREWLGESAGAVFGDIFGRNKLKYAVWAILLSLATGLYVSW